MYRGYPIFVSGLVIWRREVYGSRYVTFFQLVPYFVYFYPLAGGARSTLPSDSRMGHRARRWFWIGLFLLLWIWLFRLPCGFACPFRWFAFGVGFGRPARQLFRLSLMLVREWCRLRPYAIGLGFGRVRLFRLLAPLFGASRWSNRAGNWEFRVTN